MLVVKPNAMYLSCDDTHPYAFIERVGRTCYKSEDKITENSSVQFIKKLKDRGHLAMLEHAYAYFHFHPMARNFVEAFAHNESQFTRFLNFDLGEEGEQPSFMTASFTALLNFFNDKEYTGNDAYIYAIKRKCQEAWPEVFGEVEYYGAACDVVNEFISSCDDVPVKRVDRLTYIERVKGTCTEVRANEVFKRTLPHTVLLTIDCGACRELVRHRDVSYAHESTRYCNYSKAKFGGDIKFVEPFWYDDPAKYDVLHTAWREACKAAESAYFELLANGAAPEEARQVLPFSLASDIVVTAVEREWEHIINLRVYGTTGRPHPDMRRVMLLATQVLNEHSEGRLYPTPYAPPKEKERTSAMFYTITDERNYPVKEDGEIIFTSSAVAARICLNTLLEEGKVKDGRVVNNRLFDQKIMDGAPGFRDVTEKYSIH